LAPRPTTANDMIKRHNMISMVIHKNCFAACDG